MAELPLHRASVRAKAKYLVQADIARCFPSIYTHSIPWAIHTKAIAKANHGSSLYGNQIDTAIRNAQDGQTIGIPIGLDPSFVVCETILRAIDVRLAPRIPSPGFRYMDDYEFGCRDLSEAEHILGVLEEELVEYELALNPTKTRIAALPMPIESPGVSELRVFRFRGSTRGQRSDLIRYFDRAFELFSANPNEGILKYAVARVGGERVQPPNWKMFEDLLLQCALVEPGTLRFALDILRAYGAASYPVNLSRIGEALDRLVDLHAPLGHGSEVAWALWGAILHKTPISAGPAQTAIDMNDSIVALLALDAQSQGLLPAGVSLASLMALMSTSELRGEQWLASYEANAAGWLPSAGRDHVAADPDFGYLKSQGVRFYDTSAAQAAPPPVPLPVPSVGTPGASP